MEGFRIVWKYFAVSDCAVETTDAFDVDADDEMRSGTAVVHLRRSCVAGAQSLMKDVQQHFGVGDFSHVRSLHPHDALLVFLDFQFHLFQFNPLKITLKCPKML